MPRRKKKGSSRKRPLVFTESPVEVSRRFPSPIFSARNPIRADLVAVQEKQQLWVSPQIDPNAPHTPPRRGRARRNKTACALDPFTQTQQRNEIARRETANRFTSLHFRKDKGDNKDGNRLTAACGLESTDSSTEETSAESTLTDADEKSSVGVRKPTRSADEEQRSPLGEITGRTRTQRRRSHSASSQICNRPCSKNLQENSGLTSVGDTLGNNCNPCTRISARQKENNSVNGDPDKLSSNQVNRNNIRDDDNRTLQKNVITSQSENQRTHNTRRSARNGGNGHLVQFPRSGTSPPDSKTKSSKSRAARLRKSSATSDNTVAGFDGDTSQQRRRRAKKTSSRKTDVLAYDTPEAEYGIRVSMRRRRKLLPTPARNKLMLCL